MVSGPTPPGTGVMAEATSFTLPKSTSPLHRQPLSTLGSSTRLVPTSTTTAPGLTMSALISSGTPTAATRMSARLVSAVKSRVRVWQMVGVACPRIQSMYNGLPTILLRPTIVTFCPRMGIPSRSSISIMPEGVAGTRQSSPKDNKPMLTGLSPSTSLAGDMRR